MQGQFLQESGSSRWNEVPKCLVGFTIFSRASRRPSSLWSKSQLWSSGSRCKEQNTKSVTENTCKTIISAHSMWCSLSCNGFIYISENLDKVQMKDVESNRKRWIQISNNWYTSYRCYSTFIISLKVNRYRILTRFTPVHTDL